MKKLSLLTAILVALAILVSCAGTKTEKDIIVDDVVTIPTDAQVATVVEPVEQVSDAIVIEEAFLSDYELYQNFSYAYGHLLATNMIAQDLGIVYKPFILGSTDFFHYRDPVISEDQIDSLFMNYQMFLDGELTETDLEELAGEPVGALATFYEKFSYGYGYVLQYNLQSQGIEFDLDSFNNGVADAYAEIPLRFTDEEVEELFYAYQERMMAKYHAIIEEIASANLKEAEEFLAENKDKEGIKTTESGLQYAVISEGKGEKPDADATVEVDYMITFLDGSTGDSSYARGESATFNLENLIDGFTEGVQLMSEGSHYRFYLHPSLAYGEMGNDAIPPNALLIFDVELHNIVD
jgi:FKBP-type peptidyl-prolyl cis-trans isomerase